MVIANKPSDRISRKIEGLFGKTIDPFVLETELYRLHPEIEDVDKLSTNQLDLLLTTTYAKIMTGTEVSPRLAFEEKILPNTPRLLTTDASIHEFYYDEPVKLHKSQSMALIDQFKNKALEISKKRAIMQRKRDELFRAERTEGEMVNHWNYGEKELQALEDKIKKQIDTWTSQMDEIVRNMMNSMDLESVGEFVGKYADFKRALKYNINNIRWQAMEKGREALAAEKPVKSVAKSMKAMRGLAKSFFSTDEFNHKTLRRIEGNIYHIFDEVV